MASVSARRPLPALIFLLGLSLLTALVWWRVIHRSDSGHPKSEGTKTCASTTSKVVPQPGSVTVKVLNSTDRLHLARTVSTQMSKLGFHMVAYGNDSSGTVSGVAEIRYGTNSTEGATLVSLYLPGATLVPTQEADTQIVVSLGSKYKTLASPTQAKAAMNSQHITQQPARPNPAAATPTASATPSC